MSQEVLEKTEPELHNEFVGLFYENLGPVLEEAFDGWWSVIKYPDAIGIVGSLKAVYVTASWDIKKGEVVIVTRRSFKSLTVHTTHRSSAKSLSDVVLAVAKALMYNEGVEEVSIEGFVK